MFLLFEKILDNTGDLESLYNLKCEANDIYWSGYKQKPNREQFANWYQLQLKRNDRDIYLIKNIAKPIEIIGYLYLTYENEENLTKVFVSHGISEQFKGNGFGSQAVNFVTNLFVNGFLKADQIQAWIASINYASIKTFLKNGFVKTDLKKQVFYDSLNQNITLENYTYFRL